MSTPLHATATGAGARPPRVERLRLCGPTAERTPKSVTLPFGAALAAEADAEAVAVALGPAEAADLASVARALPDPDALPAGALVFVLPAVVVPASLGSRLLAAIGRARSVPRELRCTALVARGYVRVAAGTDTGSRSDLVWGYAPGTPGT